MKGMYKLSLTILLYCFLVVNLVVAQESNVSWREQLESVIKYHQSLSDKECGGLHFINYTYKGKISSEKIKSEVLDNLFFSNTIYPVVFPSIIEKDTTYTGNERIITRIGYPQFKLVTIGSLTSSADSKILDKIKNIRKTLEENIQLGFEYVEEEWNYEGKALKSLCIVSEEGIVYSHFSCEALGVEKGYLKETITSNMIKSDPWLGAIEN